MARIRTIKPEFPQSESMGRVSRDARLLFIQLWTLCDDEGRTRAASRMLASLLFPYDDDAPRLIDGWLAELEAEGCIVRYEIDGATYLQVAKWLSHQKIDHASKSKIPPPEEGSRVLARPRDPSWLDQGSRIKEGIKELAPGSSPPDARPPRAKPTKDTAPTAAAWTAYSGAYVDRYGADPVRNAKVNGQLANLVARLGAEAAEVARYFVGLGRNDYVRSMHSVDLLLRDAEALRTAWATNRAPPDPRPNNRDEARAERIRELTGGLVGGPPKQGVIDVEARTVAP